MASAAAAANRALSLSRIFASSSPAAKPPKSTPNRPLTPKPPAADSSSSPAAKLPKSAPKRPPTPNPPAADAVQKPLGVRRIIERVVKEPDPDKLVSEFVAASAASSGFRDKHYVFKVAVTRLASLGRHDCVEAILAAQKPFLTEGLANRLISLYGRASMPSHAAATFRDLPAQHKSTTTFNSLLFAYAVAGECDAIAAALQEIPASHPSIVPDVHSYNSLLSALCRSRKLDLSGALDALALMEKSGISPNNTSFTTLLNGFYNGGRMDDAQAVWEMIEERNLELDAKSYNARIRGLVAQGRIQDAVAFFERMEKEVPKPNTVSYNELIRGYCQHGRLEEAKKLYDALVKNGCAPNVGTYETLLPRLLHAGQLDCAKTYCHDILRGNSRVKCSVLQDVVTALVQASRMEEAAEIVERGLKKDYHPWKGLSLPHTRHDLEVQAEADEAESMSVEEAREDSES